MFYVDSAKSRRFFIYCERDVLGRESLDLKLHRKVVKFLNVDPVTTT